MPLHSLESQGRKGGVVFAQQREVEISTPQQPEDRLKGTLSLPPGCQGVVLFAHGSGSGRFSPRNQQVAQILRENHLGTLLIDLLLESESDDRAKVFDIDLLARRVLMGSQWLRKQEETRGLPTGCFGASTGAAAALVAAARRPRDIRAVVCRGGRPDLAGDELASVLAPTLLIVGGSDHEVLRLNHDAMERISCEKRLIVIPGATHLFSEPGALEEVARLASEWFLHHLAQVAPRHETALT